MSRRTRIFLYVAFGFVSLGLALVLTFPFDVLGRRMETEFAREFPGGALTVNRIGPSLPLGLYMGDIEVELPGKDADSATKLQVDSVRVRPAWLKLLTMKPGVAFSIGALAGRVSGEVWGNAQASHLDVKTTDVHLEEGGLLEKLLGVQLQGAVSGHLNAALGPGVAKGSPQQLTDGVLTATIDSARIKGGKVMGFAIPATDLGSPEVEINIVKGEGKIETLKTKSSDLDLAVTGTVSLRPNIAQSPIKGTAKVKLSETWFARNPTLQSMMSILPANMRKPDGTIEVQLNGTLARPANLAMGGGFPRF